MAGPWEDFGAVVEETPPWDDFKAPEAPPWQEFGQQEIENATAQQAIEANPPVGELSRNFLGGLSDTLMGLIPRDATGVAALINPAVIAVEEGKHLYGAASDFVQGKPFIQSLTDNMPMAGMMYQAEQTPPGSRERWAAGTTLLAQLGMQAAGVKGGLKAFERPATPEPTVIEPEVSAPVEPPTVPEPPAVGTTAEMPIPGLVEPAIAPEAAPVVETPIGVTASITEIQRRNGVASELPTPENTIRNIDEGFTVEGDYPVSAESVAKARAEMPSKPENWSQERYDIFIRQRAGAIQDQVRRDTPNEPRTATEVGAPEVIGERVADSDPSLGKGAEGSEGTVEPPASATPAEAAPETLPVAREGVTIEPAAPLDGGAAAPEVPPQDRAYAGLPEPKQSKIGKSIEAKAVEAKLADGFAHIAEYDPITIADQAQRATGLIKDNLETARAIVRGEQPLPADLRGTALITAMEEHILRNPDAQLSYELANSRLASATSAAAQEMRLMAERVPDSLTAKFREIREARREGSQKRGQTVENVKAEMKTEIQKVAAKAPAWEAFVRLIAC